MLTVGHTGCTGVCELLGSDQPTWHLCLACGLVNPVPSSVPPPQVPNTFRSIREQAGEDRPIPLRRSWSARAGPRCWVGPWGGLAFSASTLTPSVQLSSVAQSCPTLCDPMDCSTPGFPVHHQLPELTHTHIHRVSDAILPSHPLSSPSPPAFNLSQHQGLFQ